MAHKGHRHSAWRSMSGRCSRIIDMERTNCSYALPCSRAGSRVHDEETEDQCQDAISTWHPGASLHSTAELAALFCTHPYIAFFQTSAMETRIVQWKGSPVQWKGSCRAMERLTWCNGKLVFTSGGIVTLRGYSTFSWYKLGKSPGAVQHLLAFSHLSLLQQVTTQQIKRFNLRGHPVGLL